MNIKTIIKAAALIALVTVGGAFAAKNVTIRPSTPTHYFFTPMARVNDTYHMVGGLHELSYALPGNLQIQASLVDNIGKTNLGLKYGLNDNLAIGGGLATSLIDFGKHGPGRPARLGMYLTYAFAESNDFGMAITPNIQVMSRLSVGADFGLMIKPVDVWGFIFEAGLSVDTHDEFLYGFIIGGLRFTPPSIPFMVFDLGVGTSEFNFNYMRDARAIVFFDIMICFRT